MTQFVLYPYNNTTTALKTFTNTDFTNTDLTTAITAYDAPPRLQRRYLQGEAE